jgi:PHP family Zn ribbon phosphoesterase
MMKIKKCIKGEILEAERTLTMCNQCGKKINKGSKCLIVEGAAIVASFSYGSPRDRQLYNFHLCEECFDEIVSLFIYPPERVD